MSEISSCVEQDALVDYLYGEADTEARQRVDTHLRCCARCAHEIRSLKDVRGSLESWVPPEAAAGFRVVSDARRDVRAGSFLGPVWRRPIWGLAAAAVLVLAATVAIAQPEIEFGPDWMVVRVGWSQTASDFVSRPDTAPRTAPVTPRAGSRQASQMVRGTPIVSGAPETRTPSSRSGRDIVLGSGGLTGDGEWLQGVRELIRESEQRLARALTDQVQEVERRIEEQRQADLSEMERTFREVDPNDAERARQQLLEYMRRISARR